MSMHQLKWLCWLGGWLLCACSFDDHRRNCAEDSDCFGEGMRCYKSFCVASTGKADGAVRGSGEDASWSAHAGLTGGFGKAPGE